MGIHIQTNGVLNHMKNIQDLIFIINRKLNSLAEKHDLDKLQEPIATIYSEIIPRYTNLVYGTEEFESYLETLNKATNHYNKNEHHPEHFKNGINGMNLLNIIEMFCDWYSASIRDGGNIYKSISVNKKRFDISNQLEDIFLNTANFLEKAIKIERSLNEIENENIKSIVYDWYFGIDINEGMYQIKYEDIDLYNANILIKKIIDKGIDKEQ